MKRRHTIGLIVCWILTGSAFAEGSAVIDSERLHQAGGDANNWLTFGHDYTNQRFSALDSISAENIDRLAPKWIFQSGEKGSFQAQPLVADGVMYVTLPGNDVVALNAETGRKLWQYRHQPRRAKTKGGPANRGAALGYGKVFEATNDGRLLALDRRTGKVVWDVVIATAIPEELAGLNAEEQAILAANIDRLPAKVAPLVYDETVVVGVTSAGYGIFYNFDTGVTKGEPPPAKQFLGQRGYIAAFDVYTGKERWRWHTTRNGDWEGVFADRAPTGEPLPRDIASEKRRAPGYADRWRIGGSSTWMTPSFDAKLGLIFLGTGNASPNDTYTIRPGDNLYANSLVAIDAKTGETRWHYQQVPHDLWGYDLASASVLFDLPTEKGSVPAIGIASKTGWFYVHDRRSGELIYRSDPVVPQSNLFAAPTEDGVLASPGSFGGVSWSPTSFDPRTGIVYVAGIHKPTRYFLRYGNYGGEKVPYIEYDLANKQPNWGTLTALDTRNRGKTRWQIKTDLPLIGGVLATAGDLVFVGEGDGTFAAHRASSGERLWQFNCGAGVNAPPVSYKAGGKQFIAVAAGGHFLMGYPGGNALIAFGLAE